ncbi:MAG: methylated-DNA--[protein]-cysteine S-methyltransferase [Candidatus Glassbacteria bacterium]
MRGEGKFQHACFESFLGEGFVAAHDGKLYRIEFGVSEDEFLAELRQRYGIESSRAQDELKDILQQIEEYFAGERRNFEIEISLREGTSFERKIWKHIAEIPWGETRSYAELARAAGAPGAARAVGRAMGKNPLPIVLPCHRVVRSDGTPGGFGLGPRAKRSLLELEGITA